jgi:hypothetical protein
MPPTRGEIRERLLRIVSHAYDGGVHGTCYGCPYASGPLGSAGEIVPFSEVANDPTEAYFICSLPTRAEREKKVEWGEYAPCTTEEWATAHFDMLDAERSKLVDALRSVLRATSDVEQQPGETQRLADVDQIALTALQDIGEPVEVCSICDSGPLDGNLASHACVESLRLRQVYGSCAICFAPRHAVVTEDKEGRRAALVCTAQPLHGPDRLGDG